MEKSKSSEKKKKLIKKSRELIGKTGAVYNKVKKRIKSFIGIILAKAHLEENPVKLKEYSAYALYSFFGFLMSAVIMPQRIRPLGLSAICAMSDKNAVLFTYIGASLGCITYGNDALFHFIVYFMLYAVRKTFTDSKYTERLSVKCLESAAASAVIGIIRICIGSESALYSYVAFLSMCAISVSYTYFFGVLFNKPEYVSSKMSTVSICSYALMAAIVMSVKGVTVGFFDAGMVTACLITLSYAVVNGFLHAGSVGFICGIAAANPVMSACLGLSGLVSSLMLQKSIAASAISFTAVFFAAASYSSGLAMAWMLLPSVICGCVLFFPVCGLLPEGFRLRAKAHTVTEKPSVSGISKIHGKRLSEAFYSISDMFSKLAEKQKYPSYFEVETVFDKTLSTVCAGCALSEMCYAKRKTDMCELKNTLFAVMNTRYAQKEDFGENMKDKCIRIERLTDEFNRLYCDMRSAKASDNRPFLMGAQYAGFARLMGDADKKSSEGMMRDTVFENKLIQALKASDIPFVSVRSVSEREKRTEVHGICLDRIPFGANELKKYIYAKTGVKITEPVFDISEKNDYVMSFSAANLLRFEYSEITLSKKDKEVCGDTVKIINGKKGYFRAMVCDGMGSGKEAAVSSRIASLFLEKMLDTDTDKGIILELLGNALMARSEESFSTVDLFEADLYTGKSMFVKAGAAPSYVIRTGKLYKIFSATPPVGIIPGFTSEITRFGIEKGDIIVMVSDGAVQNNEDNAFIAELIKLDTEKSTSELAKEISEKCTDCDEPHDDISICVIKAMEENA